MSDDVVDAEIAELGVWPPGVVVLLLKGGSVGRGVGVVRGGKIVSDESLGVGVSGDRLDELGLGEGSKLVVSLSGDVLMLDGGNSELLAGDSVVFSVDWLSLEVPELGVIVWEEDASVLES